MEIDGRKRAAPAPGVTTQFTRAAEAASRAAVDREAAKGAARLASVEADTARRTD